MDKSVFKSRTFWINLVMALLPIFPAVSAIVANHPEIVVSAFSGINIFLRLISKDRVYLI